MGVGAAFGASKSHGALVLPTYACAMETATTARSHSRADRVSRTQTLAKGQAALRLAQAWFRRGMLSQASE